MTTAHEYLATLEWTGSTGSGYRSYSREHRVSMATGADVTLSADAAFRGDATLPNPEQLLVAAASSCQLLSFLGAAARAGVDVVAYRDMARGTMPVDSVPVAVTDIELRPQIQVRDADAERVEALVGEAHDHCYIANSLRSDVRVLPTIEVVV